jgi:hypothetical protein
MEASTDVSGVEPVEHNFFATVAILNSTLGRVSENAVIERTERSTGTFVLIFSPRR